MKTNTELVRILGLLFLILLILLTIIFGKPFFSWLEDTKNLYSADYYFKETEQMKEIINDNCLDFKSYPKEGIFIDIDSLLVLNRRVFDFRKVKEDLQTLINKMDQIGVCRLRIIKLKSNDELILVYYQNHREVNINQFFVPNNDLEYMFRNSLIKRTDLYRSMDNISIFKKYF